MKRKFVVTVNDREYIVEVEELEYSRENDRMEKSVDHLSANDIVAPMSGKVVSIRVKEGDFVEKGSVVAIIEAMKMENEIHAPRAGKIKEIRVREGENVDRGDVLMRLE